MKNQQFEECRLQQPSPNVLIRDSKNVKKYSGWIFSAISEDENLKIV